MSGQGLLHASYDSTKRPYGRDRIWHQARPKRTDPTTLGFPANTIVRDVSERAQVVAEEQHFLPSYFTQLTQLRRVNLWHQACERPAIPQRDVVAHESGVDPFAAGLDKSIWRWMMSQFVRLMRGSDNPGTGPGDKGGRNESVRQVLGNREAGRLRKGS